MKKTLTLLVTAILLFILQNNLYARWKTTEEAEVEVLKNDVNITIKDGIITENSELVNKILNEDGRSISSYHITYNGYMTKFKLLEAKTVNGKNVYPIEEANIEDKPLASDLKGFDEKRQILVSFPHAQVGSELHLKYNMIYNEMPIPNYYANVFEFGDNEYQKSANIKIVSDIHLDVKVNDPNNVLDVKQTKDGENEIITIELKKPLYSAITNESKGYIDPKLLTWVSVSSYQSYEAIGQQYVEGYKSKIDVNKLPPLFEKIKETAEKDGKTDVEKINIVTSMLAENVRYMGDWKTIKGKIFPRDLDTIAKLAVADCKEFSISTIAILRSMGYKAYAVIVYRGDAYQPMDDILPNSSTFNHAIVKVIGKDGREFWIDPTNYVSMADGLFSDIQDRPALVLYDDKAKYEHIPAIDPKHSYQELTEDVTINEEGIAHFESVLKSNNESAEQFTGILQYISKEEFEDTLINLLTHSTDAFNKKCIIPDLTSRIVKNIEFRCSYDIKVESVFFKTNYGLGHKFIDNAYNNLKNIRTNQISNAFLIDAQETFKHTTIIHNVNVLSPEKLNLSINTKWFKLDRKLSIVNNGKDLQIVAESTSSKIYLMKDEMRTKEFTNLMNTVRSDDGSAVIFAVNTKK